MALTASKTLNYLTTQFTTRSLYSLLLVVVPLLIALAALCIGRYVVPPDHVLGILLSKIFPLDPFWTPVEETVVFDIRLPRVILAMFIGAGLAVAGAAFQGLFGNPLVSPHILGVSSGAGFGAALSILIFRHMAFVPLGALIFGVIAMIVALWISRRNGRSSLFMMILAGVITAALFEAMLSLIKYWADPDDTLPTIVYWLMGSLTSANWSMLSWGLPLNFFGLSILYVLRWRLNVLSLSDIEARALGVNLNRMRWIVILAATLITAASVSLAGIVGWVGLVIPHIARMIVGANHQAMIPASISLGAGYLLMVDTVARTATSAEIPLSILTAVIGAPFFAWLLKSTKGGWA